MLGFLMRFIFLLGLWSVSEALAQSAAPAAQPSPSTLEMLALPLAFFALMYVLLIRPQAKKIKEQRRFLEALKVGDQVVTSGGIMAQVKSLKEDQVELDVGCGVVKVLRDNVLPYSSAAASLTPPQGKVPALKSKKT